MTEDPSEEEAVIQAAHRFIPVKQIPRSAEFELRSYQYWMKRAREALTQAMFYRRKLGLTKK